MVKIKDLVGNKYKYFTEDKKIVRFTMRLPKPIYQLLTDSAEKINAQ
jgi:hypothetical protein